MSVRMIGYADWNEGMRAIGDHANNAVSQLNAVIDVALQFGMNVTVNVEEQVEVVLERAPGELEKGNG